MKPADRLPRPSVFLLAMMAIAIPGPAGAVPPEVPPRHRAGVAALDAFVGRQVVDRSLPALSIALVEDQAVVWSRGYGFADPSRRIPATADTIYRVGSADGLFADFGGRTPRQVLESLEMTRSGFDPSTLPALDRAEGLLWTYHGPTFPAPAGGFASTANDLARLLKARFAGGLGPIRSVRGGSTPGFSAEVATRPDRKLGVVVLVAKDRADTLTARLAGVALDLLAAGQDGGGLPPIEETTPLPPGLARRLAGRYRSGASAFDLLESGGRLRFERSEGGTRAEVRSLGPDLMVDDVLADGPRLVVEGDRIRLGPDLFARIPAPIPPEAPAAFEALVGEYGDDRDLLLIFEKDGRLHALTDRLDFYPLEPSGGDAYSFPESSRHRGEPLTFRRDEQGRGVEARVGQRPFPRRPIDGEGGRTFRITPVRPVEAIRAEGLGLAPPAETGKREPDLVDLSSVVSGLRLDIRYATANNFLGVPLYTSARALMQRPAAEALSRVQARLAPMGYGLLIHDAYRPWRVTRLFWEATPAHQRLFVADPAKGSRHNRGCAADLTLCDRVTGRAVEMVSGYDEFSDRAYPDYPGGTSRRRWLRNLLRTVMEAEGFTVNEAEWWHFDFEGWRDYPILDVPFEALPPPLNGR